MNMEPIECAEQVGRLPLPCTVLIADDAVRVRQALREMLSDLPGVTICGEAETAEEAVRHSREIQPDVLILDIRFSDGSGLDVLREVKKCDGGPLVIMLSNYAYPEIRRKGLDDGASYFFDKTIEFEDVRALFLGTLAEDAQ